MMKRYQTKQLHEISKQMIPDNALFTFSPIGKSLYSFRDIFLELLYCEDGSYIVFGKYNDGKFTSKITDDIFSKVGERKIGEPEKYDRTGPQHYIAGQKCLVKILNNSFENNEGLFCIKCQELNGKYILEDDILKNINIVKIENSYSVCK